MSLLRRWWPWPAGFAAIPAGLAVVGVLTWALWPQSHAEPKPRAREYLEYTACMLTDGHGLAGERAAAVWAGMQDASLATRAKVQYLSVVGTESAANALTYLGSLVQRRCDLVIAVGPAQVGAVALGARQYPGSRFVTVGTADGPGAGPAAAGSGAPPVAPGASATQVPAAGPGSPDAVGSGSQASAAGVTAVPWSSAAEVRRGIDTLVRSAVRAARR